MKIPEITKYFLDNLNNLSPGFWGEGISTISYHIKNFDYYLVLGFGWPDSQKYLLIQNYGGTELAINTGTTLDDIRIGDQRYKMIYDEDELFNERLVNTTYHDLTLEDMNNLVVLKNYIITLYNKNKDC